MIPVRQCMKVGAALDAIGHAAAPTAQPRPARVSATLEPRVEYARPAVLDLPGTETRAGAMIERSRAVEWRHEAPSVGRVLGFAGGLALAAWLGRAGRK